MTALSPINTDNRYPIGSEAASGPSPDEEISRTTAEVHTLLAQAQSGAAPATAALHDVLDTLTPAQRDSVLGQLSDSDLHQLTDTLGPALTGLAGAAGREQFIRAQINQAVNSAANQPSTLFDGDVYRAVPTSRFQTYADHTWSAGGRYNAPGQSALYTSPSLTDIQAEAGNYSGLDGNSVVRSQFSGELLDLRSLPGVKSSALTEPYGLQGSHRTLLNRVTGEDAYTIPRAVADQARLRGLNGVIAPANEGNTNIALFPDDPNAPATGSGRVQSGLTYLDQQDFSGGGSTASYKASGVKSAPADVSPNRSSPAVDPAAYSDKVAADADAHGRAGGARYGAAGAAVATLFDDIQSHHFDAGQLAGNTLGGAAIGQADTLLSRAIDKAIAPPIAPPNVAGSALADASVSEAGAASRAVSVAAGISSAGIIGGVVSGGVSVWTQADAVKDHQIAAGQATANVAVDTGVGVAAGVSGAAAGAAIGSVVPVAGTAVGAVVGFAVGMGVGWVAQHSGLVGAAKQALGQVLTDHFEKPLQKAWDGIAKGVDAVKSAAGTVANTVSSAWHSATSAVANAASSATNAVANATSSAWHSMTSWI